MAAMDEAAIGTTFAIQGSHTAWTKVEGNLWSNGLTGAAQAAVPARYFRAYIRENMITLHTRVVEADGTEKVVSTPEVREVIPASLRDALIQLATVRPSEDLTMILTQHAIPVPVRTDFTVTMRGTAQWVVTRDAASYSWGGRNGVAIRAVEGPVTISWERTFTLSRMAAPGTCICQSLTVDDADIVQHKPTQRRDTTDVVVTEFNRQCVHGFHNWSADDDTPAETEPF